MVEQEVQKRLVGRQACTKGRAGRQAGIEISAGRQGIAEKA
jgi:hypothetical protein